MTNLNRPSNSFCLTLVYYSIYCNGVSISPRLNKLHLFVIYFVVVFDWGLLAWPVSIPPDDSLFQGRSRLGLFEQIYSASRFLEHNKILFFFLNSYFLSYYSLSHILSQFLYFLVSLEFFAMQTTKNARNRGKCSHSV